MNITYHLDDIDQVARQVIAHSTNDIFIFNAPMGAGKTTLITAICKQLGVKDEISSPTFSIVNEYKGVQKTIFHFDLYRLEDERELYNMGIEDYLDQDAIILVEWPELLLPHIEDYSTITISIEDMESRKLEII